MEKLWKLEVMKLIKELDFVESEFNYKVEMLKEIDTQFKKQVESILSVNQDLKNIFTSSVERTTNQRVKFLEQEQLNNISQVEEIKVEKNPKIKSLYRVIAKATHPDRNRDNTLNELYLEATKAYEENNLSPIISICDKLKIPFDINENEFDSMKSEIEIIRSKTKFLETTYTWQWYIKDDSEKNEIVLRFIKSQLY